MDLWSCVEMFDPWPATTRPRLGVLDPVLSLRGQTYRMWPIVHPNDSIRIERAPILASVCHSL